MNILIVRLDNIGDIMITSGIACKVKDKYPTAKVVYLVRKINAILPQMYGCIDNVIAYDYMFSCIKKRRWMTIKNNRGQSGGIGQCGTS